MSDENGPIMLVATQVLRKQETRIGKIGENFTLPRTVKVSTLIACSVGGLFGAIVGLIVGQGGLRGIAFGITFGAIAGFMAVTYSPMRNESLLTWLGLTVKSGRNGIRVGSTNKQLAVGISRVREVEHGHVQLLPGAAAVPVGEYDERGVRIPGVRSVTGLGAGPDQWTRISSGPRSHAARAGATPTPAPQVPATAARPGQPGPRRPAPTPVPSGPHPVARPSGPGPVTAAAPSLPAQPWPAAAPAEGPTAQPWPVNPAAGPTAPAQAAPPVQPHGHRHPPTPGAQQTTPRPPR